MKNEVNRALGAKKPIIILALSAVLTITFASCRNPQASKQTDVLIDTTTSEANWVKELKRINKLRDDTNCVIVFFKCANQLDRIYDIYGIIYPVYSEQNKDNGWQGWSSMSDAIMIHRNHITGKKFLLIDRKTENHAFHHPVIDLNTLKICNDTGFNGFHSGDVYSFHYYDEKDTNDLRQLYDAHHPIYSKNNYDGQDITRYEIIQMTDTGLVLVCNADTTIYNY